MEKFYVYILTNKPYGTLYIGVTNNVAKRIQEHKLEPKGFAFRYNLYRLVHLEEYESISYAINREKQLKTFRREWKVALINESNPMWLDLLKI